MKINRLLFALGMAAMAVSCGGRTEKSATGTVLSAAPEAEQVRNVEITTAEARDVAQESVYSSSVLPFATNNIQPQQGGRIRKINVEVGDYVQKGQVLAEMDRLQLDQLRLQVQNDDAEYERLKTLYKEGGISASDFEAAELGYKVRRSNLANMEENTILRSPLTGYVTARNFDKGDMFSMAQPIFPVQQVVPVKLLVGVSEADYAKVKKGDKVSLTVDALPGRSFAGKVERLYPTINPQTHTVSVEGHVPNTDRALRPGMYARVTVNFGTNRHIVLPDQCIVKQEGSGQRFVYILNEDGTVRFVPVALGRHSGTDQEILSGVSEGDQVVVKGQSALKDGMKVQVLNK